MALLKESRGDEIHWIHDAVRYNIKSTCWDIESWSVWFVAKSLDRGDWRDNVAIAWVKPLPPILPKAMEVGQECFPSTCSPCTESISFTSCCHLCTVQIHHAVASPWDSGFLVYDFTGWISYSFQLKVHLGPCGPIFETVAMVEDPCIWYVNSVYIKILYCCEIFLEWVNSM